MLNLETINRQKKGVEVRAFLKDRYAASRRLALASNYVYSVEKRGTKQVYTVKFQFVRLAFMGHPNQYRAYSCNCPRFSAQSNCHHLLLAIDEHAQSEGESLALETFGAYELSRTKESELRRALAA